MAHQNISTDRKVVVPVDPRYLFDIIALMPKKREKRQSQSKRKTYRLTIDIPDDLHRAFKAKCALERVTMADQLRKILEDEYPPKAK